MKIKTILLSLVLLTVIIISPGHANLYFWVDNQGIRHYTDTPPTQDPTDPNQIQHYQTPQYSFSNQLYRIVGEDEYCGKRLLPNRDQSDNKVFFIEILNAKSYFWGSKEYYEKQLKEQYKEKRTAESKGHQTSHLSEAISKTTHDIDICRCALEWTDHKLKELAPIKEQIIEDVRQAQKEYDEVLERCGERPSTSSGAIVDRKVAEDWYHCYKKNASERSARLKQLNHAKGIQKQLDQALRLHN